LIAKLIRLNAEVNSNYGVQLFPKNCQNIGA
jgi:hypothetical protein